MEKENFINTLLTSPLFHLSLSSKELFHSNFLAWLGELYPAFFFAVFREMGCTLRCSADDFVLKREYENFDLCLLDSDKQQIRFILENKVKSIPRAEQLKNYENKLSDKLEAVDLVLLSLATEFPDKKDIELGGWKVCNYDQLSKAMHKYEKLLPTDSYVTALVDDYCNFVGSLHNLAQSWQVNFSDAFLLTRKDKDLFHKLRIDDLQEKVIYSQMMEALNRKLLDTYKYQVVFGKGIEVIKGDSDYYHKVYTNYGFTHTQGFLEAKVKICEDYILLIQFQGDKYCHCIEWLSKELSTTYEKAWEATCKLKKSLHAFLQVDDEVPAKFPTVCVDEPIKARKYKGGEPKIYNKYKNDFLYQYKRIRKDATFTDILNAICEDVRFLIDIVCNSK